MRGPPLGTSKIPIGERGDVPLLVPVRHKPVLSSLHLRVVMACTTSATSCQRCTHSDKILGHDCQAGQSSCLLTELLDPKELEDDARPGGCGHFGSAAPGEAASVSASFLCRSKASSLTISNIFKNRPSPRNNCESVGSRCPA